MPSLRLVWWLVAVGILLAIGAYARQAQSLPRVTDTSLATAHPPLEGRALYVNCQGCHGVDGAGIPGLSPPVRGSPMVLGDPLPLARLVVHGTISRKPWPQPMPGLGQRLTDAEIASLLTWLRSSWGHAASPVTPAQVAEARPWTSPR